MTKSDLSEEILVIIDGTSYNSDDYTWAFTALMALKMGLPSTLQVARVARIHAAYRKEPAVNLAIDDNINAIEGWVVPEMYAQVDREAHS